MPSGKTHLKINWVVLVLINVLILAFSQDISIKHCFMFNICFILTSYFISPDLDIDSSTYRRYGILRLIWWPYLKLMKHGQTSHSIIWRPISIIVYIGIFIVPILFIIDYNQLVTDIILIMTITVIIICEIHIIADKLL